MTTTHSTYAAAARRGCGRMRRQDLADKTIVDIFREGSAAG